MDVLWCITGGGHLLEESCSVIERLARRHDVTVAFSKAGREVAEAYGLRNRIARAAARVVYEERQGHSSPIVGSLGSFGLVVISPCTANTAAKIALGIADSLVSNIAAQALKSGRRVVVVPTDFKREVRTRIPSGRQVMIRCRHVDLENVRRLGKSGGITVVRMPDDVYGLI